MLISNKIKNLMDVRKLTYEELANLIDMSRTGFHGAIQKGDLKVSTLNKIAKVFEVPITYFFEEELTQTNETMNNITIGGINNKNNKVIVSGDKIEIERLRKEIEYLKEQIEVLKENNKSLKTDKEFLHNLINSGNKNTVFFDKQ